MMRSFMPIGDRSQFAALGMPSKKLSADVLPSLELTEADNHALRQLSYDLEREVVQVYEEFLFGHGSRVDTLRWKQIKSHENVRVYCERDVNMRSINRLQPFFPSGQAPRHQAKGPQGLLAENSRVPILMVTGTVAGTLDDAMFGGAVHDTASLRIRNQYQREALQDCALLTTIDDATDDDPYRFLGIMWYLKSVGIPGVIDRDLLMLAQTRLTELSTGERIGVHLYHSIQHEDLPDMKEHGYAVLRANVSLVIVFRQLDERSIEVFMLDVVDAKGNTPISANLQEAAKTLIAGANICATGVKRKLHWCMRERQRKRSLSRAAPLDMDESCGDTCHVCTKSCTGFFKGPSSLCQLCRKLTCAKCTISHRIIMAANDKETETKPFGFCRVCFIEVKNLSALPIARAEAYERQLRRERGYSNRSRAYSNRSRAYSSRSRAYSDRPPSDSGTSSSTSR